MQRKPLSTDIFLGSQRAGQTLRVDRRGPAARRWGRWNSFTVFATGGLKAPVISRTGHCASGGVILPPMADADSFFRRIRLQLDSLDTGILRMAGTALS